MDYPILSPVQLSAHMRALRKSRGLSQAQLGAMLGVGQTRVTRIERDPMVVSVQQLLAVLGALGVQMVLRPVEASPATDALSGDQARSPMRSRAHKRRPSGEPW